MLATITMLTNVIELDIKITDQNKTQVNGSTKVELLLAGERPNIINTTVTHGRSRHILSCKTKLAISTVMPNGFLRSGVVSITVSK